MRKKLIKSEIAKLFNVTKATIRYYEDKKIISSEEDINGYNLYDWKDVERLDIVIFLKNLGVKIKHIKEYIDNESNALGLLQNKRKHIDEEINKLLKVKNRIDNILAISNANIILNSVEEISIEERKFFVLKELNDNNIKYFYDSVGDLYNKTNGFNEVFILLHQNYNQEIDSFEYSKMLLPYNDIIKDERLEYKIMPKGKYLGIKYVYKDIDDFKLAYDKIIKYAKKKDMEINKMYFIELEYKDYNILYKKKLYELQFEIL